MADPRLVEELLADEMPGERQYEREARIVMASLLGRAARCIVALEREVRRLNNAMRHRKEKTDAV